MKMLTTQIAGLLQRIAAQEEAIEETARLLAQASAGEGAIHVFALDEMAAVLAAAEAGAEPLPGASAWDGVGALDSADRAWLFARRADDPRALAVARRLRGEFATFAAVAAEPAEANELAELADVYVSLGFTKGLLPAEAGGRTVLPHALAAVFVLEAVRLAHAEFFE